MSEKEMSKDEAKKIYSELEEKGETLFTREIAGLTCELHIDLEKHGEEDQVIRLLTELINKVLTKATDLKRFVESLGPEFDNSGLQILLGYSQPDGMVEIRGRIFSKKKNESFARQVP